MIEWNEELGIALSDKSVSQCVTKHMSNFAKRDSYNFDPRFVLSALTAYIAEH